MISNDKLTYNIFKYTYLEECILKNFFEIYDKSVELPAVKREEVILSVELILEDIISSEIVDKICELIDSNTTHVSINNTLYDIKSLINIQKIQRRKEYHRNRREKHKEEIPQKRKEYYRKNREKILQKRKEYYRKNKEKILQKQKDYDDKNKQKLKEYREKRKEQTSLRKKEHYKKYRKEILQQNEEYRKRRKEKILLDDVEEDNKRIKIE